MKILFFITLCLISTVSFTQEQLTIGIKESHPFVIKDGENDYSGISIHLLELMLAGQEFKYVEYETVSDMIDAASESKIDVGVGTVSITSSRNKKVDFTHAYKSSELAVMYESSNNNLVQILKKSVPDLLKAVSLLGVWMLFGGLIYWLLERKREFSLKRMFYGAFNGLYWASATTTTVGYGDVSAETKAGKVFSVFWMWASIFAMGTITATIVASVNSHTENDDFNLNDSVVAVIENGQTHEIAAMQGISVKTYKNLNEMYTALQSNNVNGILHDKPILDYYVKENTISGANIKQLDLLEDRYAFITPKGSDKLNQFNDNLLKILDSKMWKRILSLY